MDWVDKEPFNRLQEWSKSFQDATIGLPDARCETGDEYEEITLTMLARPGDQLFIEAFACGEFQKKVELYFNGRYGPIYWRLNPYIQFDIGPFHRVIRYGEDGPDTEFETNSRCWKDKDWVAIRLRTRVFKVSHPIPLWGEHRYAL